jgi:hypothetical protein
MGNVSLARILHNGVHVVPRERYPCREESSSHRGQTLKLQRHLIAVYERASTSRPAFEPVMLLGILYDRNLDHRSSSKNDALDGPQYDLEGLPYTPTKPGTAIHCKHGNLQHISEQ